MKKFFRVLGLIFALGTAYGLFCFFLIRSDVAHQGDTAQDFKTILVLGSKIEPDGQPASTTKSRLDTALTLAKSNPQARVIVTGYRSSDSPVSEAEGMATYLKAHGLNSSRIIEEKKARNTVENFALSQKYVQGKTLLVTSDFHLYRSLYLASKLGYKNVQGYAAESKTPAWQTMSNYARECLALGYYLIKYTLF
ncbi:YdcF family protein [Lactococcus petauri]|uniref:YdcF family protein n=1 Tax=Lactococcus petauri TaxID=1940789 RepID=UPI003854D74B